MAHSATEANPLGQLLKEHSENVSDLCGRFSKSFGEDDGRLCGLYHDIGKYSTAFQRRLNGSTELVDHSSAGALLLFEHRNVPAAMCIAGHHAGLADLGTKNDLVDSFMGRINRAKAGGIENCSDWKKELPVDLPLNAAIRTRLEYYYYTKMLFSSLTDADWLDTEAYFESRPVILHQADMDMLSGKLQAYIAPWQSPSNEINRRRCRILNAAIAHGEDLPGLFSMTVPTGGGKTIASMAFALHHARRHGMHRVIYVIPYCSILEQTQHVFETIFGKENITAHYSGAELERDDDNTTPVVFSAENWDAPIILTTAVQFFESLYSNRPGKSRKLHNIAESVIVFDEAQMLPVPYLKPCVAAICQLVKNYRCSAVLCTATQPALEPLLQEYLPMQPVRELCPEPEAMYQAFRRVSYVDEGVVLDADLAARLLQQQQVLCIVNNRRQAQSLYNAMKTDQGVFHLSTRMTPYDRKRVLLTIREQLKAGQPCRVISTSLIEAGVDVDFPAVYRAIAGLDSIIQAGGRCNREGKRPREESVVHIFRPESKSPRMLEQNISAAEHTLREYRDVDAPETIHAYFDFLYRILKGDKQLDEKEILRDAEQLNFRTVAERFQIIDGADDTIYIPIGDGVSLISALRRGEVSRAVMRKLDLYAVSVYSNEFQMLLQTGRLEKVADHIGILIDLSLYSPEIGLPYDISKQDTTMII